MHQDLINRVQENLSKADKLKVSKIENETKLKALQESLAQDLEAAKELGYNTLDEMIKAQSELEEAIKKECDDVEKIFIEAGV